MSEFSKAEKGPNEFRWSSDELNMPMLWAAFYLDFLREDGTKRSIKSQARWNGHKQQVIIRAVDGFEYVMNDVKKRPTLEEVQVIYEAVATAWRVWYLEQVDKTENTPDAKTTKH